MLLFVSAEILSYYFMYTTIYEMKRIKFMLFWFLPITSLMKAEDTYYA